MSGVHVHIPFHKVSDYINFIISRRLNLEVYFSASDLDAITSDDITALRKKLSYTPSFSVHAPFMDLSPGAVDPLVREATVARFMGILEISEQFNAKTVVFHSGYEKWKYALDTDLWLEKSIMTWELINKRALTAGIRISIENIFENDPANLRLLMCAMDSDNFGVCFDTGHCNIFSEVPLDDWMHALNPYIFELHLHDNDGTSDQHLAIGEGSFDFSRFFDLLENKNCIYTIEARSPDDVLRSLTYLNSQSGQQ